jgi:hypothetical protein
MATTLGLGRDAARLQAILGEFLWVTEGPEVGLAATDQATELAERRGNADLAMAFRAERFGPLFDLGRWDELLVAADELTEWARTSGEGYFSIVAAVSRAQIQLYRGEIERASELAATILPAARQIEDPQVLVQAIAVAARIEQTADRPGNAADLIQEFARVTRARPTWFGAKEIPELVRTCVAVGATALAEGLLEGLPIHARRHKLSLLTAEAVLQEAAGSLETALETYVRAADGWREFGHILESGRTTLGAGRCFVQLGKPEAAERLSQARSAFGALGAAPLVSETDEWLARAPARMP